MAKPKFTDEQKAALTNLKNAFKEVKKANFMVEQSGDGRIALVVLHKVDKVDTEIGRISLRGELM